MSLKIFFLGADFIFPPPPPPTHEWFRPRYLFINYLFLVFVTTSPWSVDRLTSFMLVSWVFSDDGSNHHVTNAAITELANQNSFNYFVLNTLNVLTTACMRHGYWPIQSHRAQSVVRPKEWMTAQRCPQYPSLIKKQIHIMSLVAYLTFFFCKKNNIRRG